MAFILVPVAILSLAAVVTGRGDDYEQAYRLRERQQILPSEELLRRLDPGADTRILEQGDPGGALYVVVNGRVGIEQEKRKGSFARLATIDAHSYFGEMNLFDNSPHSASAIAVQDTLALRLRREPLIALARQYPDLSLELINVLSGRLREASDRIAELTRTRPRELHKLFDQFD